LLVPAVASAELVASNGGAFDTPFEPARQAQSRDAALAAIAQVKLDALPNLEAQQDRAPYMLATQTSGVASVFIYLSGREALPIGGFTGTIPVPTLRQLRADIRAGRFLLVMAPSTTDPRLRWIATHCAPGAREYYYCNPSDAG
jgi:hypothetical protein